MSLYESILLEVAQDKVGSTFEVSELLTPERRVLREQDGMPVEKYRIGFEFFSKTSIRSNIANAALDPEADTHGAWVKAGQTPQFERVSRGSYRILGLGEEEASEGDVTCEAGQESYERLSMAERVARYLSSEPFQIYYRRKKCFHPLEPVKGIPARLDAYFWPDQTVSYEKNAETLNRLIDRASDIASDLDANAGMVVELFQEICKWGGVPLPSVSPALVVDNIRAAREASIARPAHMNSAWTKLYAIFFPEQFVIYDSRVATALIAIAEATSNSLELDEFKRAFPAIGSIVGRGGTRPRAFRSHWRNAYGSWAAQLEANKLCAEVLAVLNHEKPIDQVVRLRELEAVLFMEGY